jgi:hypothetical protein
VSKSDSIDMLKGDMGGDTGDPGTGVDVQSNWSNEVFER